jgi:hypothetical protein
LYNISSGLARQEGASYATGSLSDRKRWDDAAYLQVEKMYGLDPESLAKAEAERAAAREAAAKNAPPAPVTVEPSEEEEEKAAAQRILKSEQKARARGSRRG